MSAGCSRDVRGMSGDVRGTLTKGCPRGVCGMQQDVHGTPQDAKGCLWDQN